MAEHEEYIDTSATDVAAPLEEPSSAAYVPPVDAGAPPAAAPQAAAGDPPEEPLFDSGDPLFGSAGYRYDIEDAVSDKGNPVVGDTSGRLYDRQTGEELSKY